MVPLKVQQGSSLGDRPIDDPVELFVHIFGPQFRKEGGYGWDELGELDDACTARRNGSDLVQRTPDFSVL